MLPVVLAQRRRVDGGIPAQPGHAIAVEIVARLADDHRADEQRHDQDRLDALALELEALPGGLVEGTGTLPYAQTMAFTTLMLFQIFNVVNARSDERSAFVHLFTNGWLWAAIAASVVLQVLVGVDGRPLQVDVRQGSGDRRLDAAAREQVLRHWRFKPAMRDGHAVQAIGLVPIAFDLGQPR